MDALLLALVRPRVRWAPTLAVAAALGLTVAASVAATLWWTGERADADAAVDASCSDDAP